MRKSEYPTEYESIGGMIRKKRMDLGMTLLELSKKIKTPDGVLNEGYLSSIEANNKVPSIEVAAKICKALSLDFKPIRRIIVLKSLEPFAAPTGSTLNLKVLEKIFIDPKETSKQKS